MHRPVILASVVTKKRHYPHEREAHKPLPLHGWRSTNVFSACFFLQIWVKGDDVDAVMSSCSSSSDSSHI
jgi:hypothetical protein